MLHIVGIMPSKVKITFLCDPETREKLERIAEDEGRSLSNLVERLVLAEIDRRDKK